MSQPHIGSYRSMASAIVELYHKFYGTIDKFDPRLCQPHLKMFLEDECPPSAILLEYIPDLEMIL